MDNAVLETLMDTGLEVVWAAQVVMLNVPTTEIGKSGATKVQKGKSYTEQGGGTRYTEQNQQFGQSRRAKTCSRTVRILDATKMTAIDSMTATSMVKKHGKE